ncbi:MAG: peptidylprolyl isomerase [Melioribacteraceae bacterium]|nr:peptidylprolyl isomerase [Melioribacteraceae bacterium]
MKKLIFIFSILTILNAQQTLDKIVAVVGNEIILQSELNLQAAYVAAQRNIDPDSEKLKQTILERMIEEKLLYAQAELDTIQVSDQDVEMQLENQLNFFISQYGSQDRLEQAYGMGIDKIKRELRDEVRKSLMSQMVQQKEFGQIEVTRREVREFFETNKDSLGTIPEKFELKHIFINPQKSDRLKIRAKEFANTLLDSIKNGADFAKLASENSDDPGSAKQGGDLGFVKRGVFFPEFEAAAFQLEEGELSDVIETPVGFHIIQMLERRGESIKTRHILVKVKSDDEADFAAIELLNEIRDSLVNGHKSFEYFARKYSDDGETAKNGGNLGTFEVSQLDDKLKERVYELSVGEISYPKRLDLDNRSYGYHIIKLVNRTPEHRPVLDEDFDEIKRLAIYNKRQKLYSKWIEELKEKIYWNVKI